MLSSDVMEETDDETGDERAPLSLSLLLAPSVWPGNSD